jgi:hypothetical protein
MDVLVVETLNQNPSLHDEQLMQSSRNAEISVPLIFSSFNTTLELHKYSNVPSAQFFSKN